MYSPHQAGCLLQYELCTRIRGPLLASYGAYYDEDCFRTITGIRTTKMVSSKKTETTVSHPFDFLGQRMES